MKQLESKSCKHLAKFMFLIILFIESCGMSGGTGGANQSNDTIRFETDTICAGLTGVSNYQIGKTTYKQVLRDKNYISSTPDFARVSTLYSTHWIPTINNANQDKTNWIEKNIKGVKSLKAFFYFKIDELEFSNFEFAFLNDTLVAIYFLPNSITSSTKTDLLKHYNSKYGSGSGKKYHKSGKDNYFGTKYDVIYDYEEILWKGVNVELTYFKDYHFVYQDNQMISLYSYTDEYFLIYNPNRYPEFIRRLKEASLKYDEFEKAKKEATFDAF